jgi:hypothetical protein
MKLRKGRALPDGGDVGGGAFGSMDRSKTLKSRHFAERQEGNAGPVRHLIPREQVLEEQHGSGGSLEPPDDSDEEPAQISIGFARIRHACGSARPCGGSHRDADDRGSWSGPAERTLHLERA